MLRVLLVGCAIGLLGLVACSGSDGDSDDRVLELRGYDITEQDYQTTIRLRFLNPLDASVCDSLVGLSPEDVVELATLEIETNPQEPPSPRATVKPDQLGDPDDRERAAEIILEECDRLSD